jgi:hypothetical protein
MRDELEKLNGEINAKLALIEELRQRMQTAWSEVHSRLERGEEKQAWAALDRYYAAKDTLFTAHQGLAVTSRQATKVMNSGPARVRPRAPAPTRRARPAPRFAHEMGQDAEQGGATLERAVSYPVKRNVGEGKRGPK